LLAALIAGCASTPSRDAGQQAEDLLVWAVLPSRLDSSLSPYSPTALSSLDVALASALGAQTSFYLLPPAELERSYASVLRDGAPDFQVLVTPTIAPGPSSLPVLHISVRGKDTNGRPINEEWSAPYLGEANPTETTQAFSVWVAQRPYVVPPATSISRPATEQPPGQGPRTGETRSDGLVDLQGLSSDTRPGIRFFARGRPVIFTDPVTGLERILAQGTVVGLVEVVDASKNAGTGRILSGQITPGLSLEPVE
jgi:hypothetical protein